MLLPSLASSLTSSTPSRICALLPQVSRRTLVNRAALRSAPEPRPTGILPPFALRLAAKTQDGQQTSVINTVPITTPAEFLKAIGRDSESKLQIEGWEEFWKTDGQAMKKAGVGVKERRYILWCMEKYRSGMKIQDFAHEPKPKKTVRGWGPAVQNGKRIRSRRHKDTK
ncbi:hypothetical protein AX16_008484 [Volvariella volvacea WC 439]|nr:hypothetical protein AX16_008484 [Volvariella volvacea WC 439]